MQSDVKNIRIMSNQFAAYEKICYYMKKNL